MVLACAMSAKADCVVSGDPHLLEQHRFQNIPILTANAFLEHVGTTNDNL
jgi:predicted nucleic acid-binding protein